MKRKLYELKAGNMDNLRLVEKELDLPTAHEVSVEIKSIGLNFADVFAMWGLYGATPEGVFTPGLEYSGVVVAKGNEANEFEIGDRVMGVTRFGAYTSHLNINQQYLSPIPEDWTFEEGAAYLVQALTAYYGLMYLGDLQEGATVLIHSAAGGVGTLANRIAKTVNAYTIGSVGRKEKLEYLTKEGYDKGIVRSDGFANDLKNALEGRGLNLIMECIGGRILKEGYDQLAPQGRMVIYGSARYASPGRRPNYFKVIKEHITRPKFDPQMMVQDNRGILGFNLIYLYEKVELMRKLLEELNQLDLGKPHVGHMFGFDQLREAITLFQSGKTVGKVVVNL